MLQGVCRVCGSPLALPIVTCPACATPHHQDCWEYNGGCTIFGCTGTGLTRSPAVVSLPVPLPPASIALAPRVAGSLFALIAVGMLFGGLAALAGAGALAHWLRRQVPGPLAPPLEAPVALPPEDIELEAKEVARLIGAGEPEHLAQAYALFEQRHPRDALAAEAQGRLATELLAAGHVVLGVEALDKAARAPDLDEPIDCERARRAALLAEPASLEEALCGPTGVEPLERRVRLAPVVAACATGATLPAGPVALLAACATGWPLELRVAAAVPSLPGKRHVSALLAGPFGPDAAGPEIASRLDAGCPLYVVPAAALELPPVEPVQLLHVSQKGLRVRTSGVEAFFDWSEVVEIFHARLDQQEERATLEREDRYGPRGGRATEYHMVKKLEVTTRPILEILTAGPARRLVVDAPHMGLFDYLGRRKELSHAYNLTLAVKDLVRFCPGARASGGVHCLFGERTGPGFHIGDPVKLEHARAWFHALGSPAVRATWPAVVAAAEEQPS